MLALEELHAQRGDTRILHGVSLQVAQGEIVALIGRNGMGKTTLLRSVIGLSQVTQGSVKVDGKDVTHLPTHLIVRRGIGVVLEGRGIFTSLSVDENLRMGVNERFGSGDAVASVYAQFPMLQARARDRAGALSGGQQQLLAIARALASQPRLLLIDEFSEGVQPNIVRDISATLRRLNAEGVTILLVEQNARLALGLSQRGYVLEKGRVVADGPSGSLLKDQVLTQYLVI